MMNNVSDVTLKLERLAEKQSVWQKMSPQQKLPYLESIRAAWHKVGPAGFEGMLGQKTADMKKVEGKERELVMAEESLLAAAFSGYVDSLMETYKVLAGAPEANKEDLMGIKKRMVGDQVVAQVFPLLKQDKEGPTNDFQGEIWFQHGVKPEEANPFQAEQVQDNKDGVLCVLGAGNYNGLTYCDVLHGMFVRNRVVFCKLHPLRPFLEDLMRVIFDKLYRDGFLESEPDMGIDRSKAIVHSDFVTSVHMTGGKAAHDKIVWGASPAEQATNKANNTPVLKAEMTSELGAASPYIMTPTEYTPEELEHQAKTLISARWCNGGASCNAPQNIVVSKNWKQREAFITALEEAWKNAPPIATYYPGAPQRWEAFSSNYSTCSKKIFSKEQKGDKVDETHLPLLMAFVDVDLSSPEGRAKAEQEYAFKNEAFAPVVAVATIHDDDFMAKAAKLSNDYMFGSLSCTIAVPASAVGTNEVEQAIADLKYGAVATNAWAGQSYMTWALSWGGVYGEKLENVESGLGCVCNSMMHSKIEKSVLRTPCVHAMHFDFCKSAEEIIGFNKHVANLLMGVETTNGGA